MRNEVLDFMKQCERLLSLALQTKELSADECSAITYYAQELHDKIHPMCEEHNAAAPQNASCD